MRESVTYQAILAEGKAEGEVKGRAEGRAEGKAEGLAEGKAEGKAEEVVAILLRLGRKRFGEPSPEIVSAIEAVADVPSLEALTDRLLVVSSWDELLSGDQPGHLQ